jgi:stearoyl-CoA desaturase (delta-9 desaturase)
VEPRFLGETPSWPALDRFGEHHGVRFAWGCLYTLVYVAFAPHWAFFALLPIHWLMGPIHGAIVNWCGHRYGYRNFDEIGDRSRNTLPIDFVTMGELFQNNHHRFPMSPRFAARPFEIDLGYWMIQPLLWLGIVRLSDKARFARWEKAAQTPSASASVPPRPPRLLLPGAE